MRFWKSMRARTMSGTRQPSAAGSSSITCPASLRSRWRSTSTEGSSRRPSRQDRRHAVLKSAMNSIEPASGRKSFAAAFRPSPLICDARHSAVDNKRVADVLGAGLTIEKPYDPIRSRRNARRNLDLQRRLIFAAATFELEGGWNNRESLLELVGIGDSREARQRDGRRRFRTNCPICRGHGGLVSPLFSPPRPPPPTPRAAGGGAR